MPKLILFGPIAGDNPSNLKMLSIVKKLGIKADVKLKKLIGKRFGEESAQGTNIYVQPLLASEPTDEQIEALREVDVDPDIVYLTPDQKANLGDLRRDILRERNNLRKINNLPWLKLEDIDIEKELPPNEWHELEVAAFNQLLDISLALSTKEAFGLTILGPRLRGKLVIASTADGFVAQIRDEAANPGQGTGYLVGKNPITGKFNRLLCIRQAANRIVKAILKPELAEEIGIRAQEDGVDRFLMDRQLEDWLNIWMKLFIDVGIDAEDGKTLQKDTESVTSSNFPVTIKRSNLKGIFSKPFIHKSNI